MTWLARRLLAQAELFDERLVACAVGGFQIREQAATVVNHFEQTATAVVIFDVDFEVVCSQRVDVRGEQRDLYFSRTGIILGATMFGDDCGGLYRRKCHDGSFSFDSLAREASQGLPRNAPQKTIVFSK